MYLEHSLHSVIEVVDWYIGQVNVVTRLCGCAACAKYPNFMSWFIYYAYFLSLSSSKGHNLKKM